MSEPLIRVEGLVKSYPGGPRAIEVLRGLDFEARPGETVGIVGDSGVGKSTLLHLLGGLDRPDALPMLGEPAALFPWRYYFVADARSHFDMAADGDRFLVISAGAGDGPGQQLVLVQNWAEELKRLAPADP